MYGPLSFSLETSDGQVVNGAFGPDYVVPDGIQAGKTAQVIVAFEVPDGVTAKTLVYEGLLSDLKVTL